MADPLDTLIEVYAGHDVEAIRRNKALLETAFRRSLEALDAADLEFSPARKLVVYPGQESFPLGHDVQAVPLATLCQDLAMKELT